MFRIADGREAFYQWDLDRQVIVEDPSIVEVHFCNRTDDCSLVTEVVNGLANVPNILLQSNYDIRVFGYDGKATLHDKKFKVNARTRPADYVYTETEILSIKQLEEELRTDIDERLVNIADEVIENLDLNNYYTKEETEEAIQNSKDTYYLDFSSSKQEEQPATEEMIDFATRFLAGQNLCAHVKTNQSAPNPVLGWQPVTINKAPKSVRLTPSAFRVSGGNYKTTYYVFTIKQNSNGEWVYFTYDSNSYAIATTDYVDEAIANIEIPEGPGSDIDLSKYATKAYVEELNEDVLELRADIEDADFADKAYVDKAINTAFAGIATAEGGSY